jgi:photosystem II stability/assembly factor-like uncharacterized protein/outer membrane lipoprotein-sorting protein
MHASLPFGTTIVVALSYSTAALAVDVDELTAKHVEALGGKAKLAALSSLELSGKLTVGVGDQSFDLTWKRFIKRPGMVRDEASLQGLTAVTSFDGKEGWSVQPFFGRRDPERMSVDDAKQLEEIAELEGPLAGWREKGYAVEYLGTQDVDGTDAHKLKVIRKNGNVQYVFLDPEYYLIIRVESHSFVRGSEQIEETDFGSYEDVGGVWIPFAIETGPRDAAKTRRRVVERAELNPKLDDGAFHFPRERVAPLHTEPAQNAVLPGQSTLPSHAAPQGGTVRADRGVISGLGIRNIGSATMSGRIAAIAAHSAGGKTTVFVGAASGGVWKSDDGGTTFKPVFDKNPVQSIGAVAIDPTNPSTIWVGTGESWTRNSVSMGDGVYRSTDGGETWRNVGLPESERISKIIIHPTNGNVVYACAPGKLWSDSTDRGLYKTIDGGKSWTLVLKGSNPSTGCSGVSMEPRNPDVLIAGLWDFRRKGWTFRSGGDGPEAQSGSGLFRTTDGGKTWTELTAKSNPGLPNKPWGRIEAVYAPSDPSIVYAFIEGKDSALFYSGDGGKTWQARDKSRNMVWRPFYFSRLIVDPKTPQRLFKTNLQLIVSEDGGKSFSTTAQSGHGDWHDLWIDPENPKHVIGGDDGGLWISHDGGNRWWKGDNLPIAQFYHVSVDEKDPYLVYGGLQDNSSWVAESEYPGGIGNERWDPVFWGDGFWTLVDPTDSDAVYAESQGGYIARIDRRTRALRDIQPKARYKEKLRFNWNSPIHASPTVKGTIYLGGQFLFRSRDRGDTWERISPDLTTNDPMKQKQEESGGITVDNSSAEMHTTIYSISESPKNAKVIWVGTDDGNVQLTQDSGKTWRNVAANVPDLPQSSWVSSVEASRFDAATAYATFDRHTFGDMRTYVYKTADYGKTWARIAGPDRGLRGWAHVIKEDAKSASILFVGTEFGLWISIDGGQSWAEFKGRNFPSVAVRDLAIQARTGDLVIGTHGRGIWIIDDLSPLRALSDEVLAKPVAFLPARVVQQRMPGIGGWVNGDAKFTGENPLPGAVLSYYQRTRHLFGPLKLEVLGPDNKVVDTVPAGKRRGINRAAWTMRVSPPRVPRAAQVAFNASQGPRVVPGTYTIRLTSGKDVIESKLQIDLDRRAPYKIADRKAQFDAAMRVHRLFGRMSGDVDRIEVAKNVAAANEEKLDKSDELRKKLGAFKEELDGLKKLIVATKEGGAITGEERLREHADILYGALQIWEGRPTRYQLERIDTLAKELGDVEKSLDTLLASRVPQLDEELHKRQLQPIPTKAVEHSEESPRSSDVKRAFAILFGLSIDEPAPAERD